MMTTLRVPLPQTWPPLRPAEIGTVVDVAVVAHGDDVPSSSRKRPMTLHHRYHAYASGGSDCSSPDWYHDDDVVRS